MSKTQPKPDAAAAPAPTPAFVPTYGGVYRATQAGEVTVIEGGPPKNETPAQADQLPKAGEA